jgi:hypothetical protein
VRHVGSCSAPYTTVFGCTDGANMSISATVVLPTGRWNTRCRALRATTGTQCLHSAATTQITNVLAASTATSMTTRSTGQRAPNLCRIRRSTPLPVLYHAPVGNCQTAPSSLLCSAALLLGANNLPLRQTDSQSSLRYPLP